MAAGKIYLGNRRYSSWSMRGWLMVRLARLDVEDIVIPMAAGKTTEISRVSPNGLVPYLEHDGVKIWESLAIAEYCAEAEPALWPADQAARAHARAISAEMHAGFRHLRAEMPMNLGRRFPGAGQTPESLADIARIVDIWSATRAVYGAGGPYLFGAAFTAADAMFAPVVARFHGYRPTLRPVCEDYCAAVWAHELVANWVDLAAKEPASWLLAKYEGVA